MQLGRRQLEFVPPQLEDDEWAREQVGPVHFRPLFWTMDPPQPARPANYYAGRPGEAEYILVRVQPGDDYELGLRWFGPLPEPRG
jgi:hypothetical protein